MDDRMLVRANEEIERLLSALDDAANPLLATGQTRADLYTQVAVALLTAGAAILRQIGGRRLEAETLYALADSAVTDNPRVPGR